MRRLTTTSNIVLALAVILPRSRAALCGEPDSAVAVATHRALVGCCIVDDQQQSQCVPSIEEAECIAMGGAPTDDVACAGEPCAPAACCLPDDTCWDDTPHSYCRGPGVIFNPGRTCADDPCPHLCPNDLCANAIDLNFSSCPTEGPCVFTTNNELCDPGASSATCVELPGDDPQPTLFGADQWWAWNTGPFTGSVLVAMCEDASFDAILAVYDGGINCSSCPADASSPMACGNDTCGIAGGPPQLVFDAESYHCYYIRVGGAGGAVGSGQVTLQAGCCTTPARPMPGARFRIDGTGNDVTRSCATRSDCLDGLSPESQVDCVDPPAGDAGPGVCYVRHNRYLLVAPNPLNALSPTARRVSIDLGGGQTYVLGWMGAAVPLQLTGPEPPIQYVSRLAASPSYSYWPTDGPVHIGDCEISPGHTYFIESIGALADPDEPANYSEPLILSTAALYGDVTGATTGDPPDAVRNFKDVGAIVRGFQSTQTEPKAWLDLQGGTSTPEIPDFGDINFGDINQAVAGFQGGSYPFAAPCDCPGQACP